VSTPELRILISEVEQLLLGADGRLLETGYRFN
jgi:hypothetical protein